jgi:hypothetical protein
MRILDLDSNKSLANIIIYLTNLEAIELRDTLNEILKKPLNNHSHIPSEDFQKELTVCIYDTNNLEGFNKRSIDLIINDQ